MVGVLVIIGQNISLPAVGTYYTAANRSLEYTNPSGAVRTPPEPIRDLRQQGLRPAGVLVSAPGCLTGSGGRELGSGTRLGKMRNCLHGLECGCCRVDGRNSGNLLVRGRCLF